MYWHRRARAAARGTRNGRVGLIGTRATIRSGAYERALAALRPDAQVIARACPLLVPLVENGRYQPGDIVAETVVAEYLYPGQFYDVLVDDSDLYDLYGTVVK